MTYDEKRVAIATAMGVPLFTGLSDDSLPKRFDPLASHADAMAVVAHLRERGDMVRIEWTNKWVLVEVRNEDIVHTWRYPKDRYDYREGIVELAYKVIGGPYDAEAEAGKERMRTWLGDSDE